MSKIAAIQLEVSSNPEKNLQLACEKIQFAASQGAVCAILPEEFLTLGISAESRMDLAEEYLKGARQAHLAKCAKKNNIWIIAGTFPIKTSDQTKITAACLIWNNQGECVARYDKMHLFDVTVDSNEYRESDNIRAGDTLVCVNTPFGKIGVAICYDLRFPELFRVLALQGAQILVVPAAFTIETGQAHWQTLLKARAIENLCYVIGVGTVGRRAKGQGTYGHSMFIDPWGDVIASCDDKPAVLIQNMDLTKMDLIRNRFPALRQMRSVIIDQFSLLTKKQDKA